MSMTGVPFSLLKLNDLRKLLHVFFFRWKVGVSLAPTTLLRCVFSNWDLVLFNRLNFQGNLSLFIITAAFNFSFRMAR